MAVYRPLRRLGLVGLGVWLAASAQGADNEVLILRGFGTLGGPYSLDGSAGFIRDISQPKGAHGEGLDWEIDSRLGVQATWKPTGELETTLQLVSKYRFDSTFRPDITWAFLKYSPNPDLRVRTGRLGVDMYFQSDSRDVGYASLWVRPPVDYFGQLFFSHLDGVDGTLTQGLGDGILRGKLYAGLAGETIPVSGQNYVLDGSRIAGGYLEYQLPNWMFRLGYGAIRMENSVPAAEPLLALLRGSGTGQLMDLAQEMDLAGKRFGFLSGGIAYDNGPLQGQLMLSHLSSDSLAFHRNTAGYLLLGYRIGDWTPYLVYSRIKSSYDQPETGLPDVLPYSLINAGIASAVSGIQMDQSTYSLGVRYDFARDLDLKLQLDLIDSHANPSLLWLDTDRNWDGRAAVLSLTLDFVF